MLSLAISMTATSVDGFAPLAKTLSKAAIIGPSSTMMLHALPSLENAAAETMLGGSTETVAILDGLKEPIQSYVNIW